MRAYSEAYLNDVVENQGKLFDYVAQSFPDKDTEDFINTYMRSKTRISIDKAKAYVNTMDAKELWNYFTETEEYKLKKVWGIGLSMTDPKRLEQSLWRGQNLLGFALMMARDKVK